MSENYSDRNILAVNGLKKTKSRSAIISVLKEADTPLSADDIFIRIREQGSTANLSTVYRTLDIMESKGLVNKIIMSDGKGRFELLGQSHRHHLICTGCHKTVSIDQCPLDKLQKDVKKHTNFEITGHRLELYGLCPDCRKG
jgi:Fur family ferric uptake transcriptional regulator